MYKIYHSGKLDREVHLRTAISDISSSTKIEFIITSGFIFGKVVSQSAQNTSFGQDLTFLNSLTFSGAFGQPFFSKTVSCNLSFFFLSTDASY